VTIRVLRLSLARSIKDVPPRTFDLGEWTTGDTYRGSAVLENAVRQFGEPQGARVGTSLFVKSALPSRRFSWDAVDRLPGGTLHSRGVMRWIAGSLTVAVVGGTGAYAGATGSLAARASDNGLETDTFRLQVP
jgi:hypothetical protein